MKITPSLRTAVAEFFTLVAVIIAIFLLASAAHAQPVPAPAAAATTETLSGAVLTADKVAQAVAPGLPWAQINSAIIGIVLISRVILKYFLPDNPAPGSLAAKLAAFLNHTGGVIT